MTTTDLSALSIASFYGHSNIVKYLHSKGAKLLHKNSNKSPLIMAIKGKKYDTMEYITTHLKKGEKYSVDCHPLLIAIKSNDQKSVSVLLRASFDSDYTNNSGENIVFEAIKLNALTILTVICTHKPKLLLQEDDKYRNALMFAITTHRFDAAKVLIKNGANLYGRNSFGKNIGDLVNESKDKEAMKFLSESDYYSEYDNNAKEFIEKRENAKEYAENNENTIGKRASVDQIEYKSRNKSNSLVSHKGRTTDGDASKINGLRKRIKSIIESQQVPEFEYGNDHLTLISDVSKKLEQLSHYYCQSPPKRKMSYRNSTIASLIKDRNKPLSISIMLKK